MDLRRFPPLPPATRQVERRYQGRTAVERVNGRLKVFGGAEDGNRTGARRFHSDVGVVLVVCLGLATRLALTPRRQGSRGQTRLRPSAQALRELAVDGEVRPAGNGAEPDERGGPAEQVPAAQPDSS